ncbi:MAG: hypothetical protein JWL59_528 [Chthoniobacteraceae bacterium]|nr:hypothetical protein [Chthoniobacteraceae bacterium]
MHLATPKAEWRTENRPMNKLITILVAFAFASTAMAASYSTKATMTREEHSARYAVAVRVSKLVERDGKVMEHVICLPHIICSPGVPAFISSGQAVNPYTGKESVRIDISWPKTVRPDFAVCTVAIKLGDTIVSKTKTKMAVEE